MRIAKIPQVPHILTIREVDGEKEWEVEHPADCPRVCDWWPDRPRSDPWSLAPARAYASGPHGDGAHAICYVAYEVEAIGIDTLDIHTLDGTAHIDPDWTPFSQFEADWLKLRPGRYTIEGWFHDGKGMGDYGGQGDADGGLILLAYEPVRDGV